MDRAKYVASLGRAYERGAGAYWCADKAQAEVIQKVSFMYLEEAAKAAGFDLVPRKSSEASRADHEYRVLNGCEPPVTEATGWDARQSSRVDQPAAEGM